MDKKSKSLDDIFTPEVRESILKRMREFLNKLAECAKKGHPNSTKSGSVRFRHEAVAIMYCPACKMGYHRNLRPDEIRELEEQEVQQYTL